MKELLSFINELIVLYGIAAVGYGAKRKRIIGLEADTVLTQVILYITLPALILYSMDIPFAASLLKDFGLLVALSAYAMGLTCCIAFILARKSGLSKERSGVYQGLIIFGNQGFLGYAVCLSLFSKQGAVYTAVFNIVYLFLIWTYGIYIIAGDSRAISWKTLLFNPGVIGTVTGLLVFLLPFQWPSLIAKFLQSIGTTTTPLSMLLIGSLMANLDIRQLIGILKGPHIWVASLSKLLLIPLIMLPLALLGIKSVILMVAVLVSSMPSGPTTPMFAEKYGADAYFGSVGVCVTTLLALFTLPLLYWIVNLVTK